MLNTSIIKKSKKLQGSDSAAKADLFSIDLAGDKPSKKTIETPKVEFEESIEITPKSKVPPTKKSHKAEDLATIDLAMAGARKGSKLETIQSLKEEKEEKPKSKYLDKIKSRKGA